MRASTVIQTIDQEKGPRGVEVVSGGGWPNRRAQAQGSAGATRGGFFTLGGSPSNSSKLSNDASDTYELNPKRPRLLRL